MNSSSFDHDAIVVGSGFGGSVTAFRLSEAGLDVCVLERGKPYPPGKFPRSPEAMARNFWDPSEGLQGMFDIWSFSRMEAVVSSGLGGGSLIYANVQIRKDENWFVHEPMPDGGYEDWPVTRADLDPHYDSVEKVLDVQPYPFDLAPYSGTRKTIALKEAAERLQLEWSLPNLAVSFRSPGEEPVPGEPLRERIQNLHGVPRSTCRLVGECDVGCNYGAKNSLDLTYLTLATRKHRAKIRTLCEVRTLRPIDGGFEVGFVEHDPETEGCRTNTRRLPLRRLRCRRLILSAGTLGTTYLLFKNRRHFPGMSARLGTRFSGNGDFLGFVLRARKHESGNRRPRVLDPGFGPVIASTIRVPDEMDSVGVRGRGFYIQDAGYPDFINWLVESGLPGQGLRLARFLANRGWARLTGQPKTRVGAPVSRFLGRNTLTATSMPLLGMGRDVPDGEFCLHGGNLDLRWTSRASREYFRGINRTMRDIAHEMGGIYASGPLWWVNMLITVHPVGGAPMGRDPSGGVVDPWGQVFGYEGLSIADGSVMPGPVGPNPSLTIAALADRFATRAIEQWEAAG